MVDVKRCARCGCMIVSEKDVCEECFKKDARDITKLKVFLEDTNVINTKGELSIATGIVNKNLSRFLEYDEFKGINITSEIKNSGEETLNV